MKLALELGHLFIYMGYRVKSDRWYKIEIGSSYTSNSIVANLMEEYIKEFALSLLMPKEMFIRLAKETFRDGSFDLFKLSKSFKVPLGTIKYRGTVLNLWE